MPKAAHRRLDCGCFGGWGRRNASHVLAIADVLGSGAGLSADGCVRLVGSVVGGVVSDGARAVTHKTGIG